MESQPTIIKNYPINSHILILMTGITASKILFLPKPRFQSSFLETLNYDLIEPIRVNYDVAVLTFIQRPKNYYSDYKFKPTDTFKLSENGLDLLDDIKEAQHKKILNLITLFLSFVAALTGVIACIR